MNKKMILITSIVIFLLVIAGVAFAYANQNRKNAAVQEQGSSNTPSDSSNTQQRLAAPFVLDDSKLPAGWRVGQRGDNAIVLTGDGCSISATYFTDSPNKDLTQAELQQKTLQNIQSKGYNVISSIGSFDITTESLGEINVRSQKLTVSGMGNAAMYQEYFEKGDGDAYTMLQLSCESEADLTSAKTAVKAITLTRYISN